MSMITAIGVEIAVYLVMWFYFTMGTWERYLAVMALKGKSGDSNRNVT